MKKKIPISYTDRDFNSIKKSLVQYARRYYPDTYKDFNEASFGSFLLDTVSSLLLMGLDKNLKEFLNRCLDQTGFLPLQEKNLLQTFEAQQVVLLYSLRFFDVRFCLKD